MLEILAVIAIFMILLAMVLYPASRWHRQQRIRSAVAVVQSAMRLAREQAMTRRESVSVFFRNEVASNRIVRSFYWIHGDQSQNLGLTNTIPNGVSFFFYEPLYSTGSPNTLAVCITGDSVTGGDWVVFTTNEFPISFTPSGIATSSLIVGVAESAPPGGGLALTGLVSVAGPSSGYITTDPAMP
jgi:type II secretory pathway pseudopilin PulG